MWLIVRLPAFHLRLCSRKLELQPAPLSDDRRYPYVTVSEDSDYFVCHLGVARLCVSGPEPACPLSPTPVQCRERPGSVPRRGRRGGASSAGPESPVTERSGVGCFAGRHL